MMLMLFYAIRSTGGGLNLLKSDSAYINTISSAGRPPNAQVTIVNSSDILQTLYPQYFEKISIDKIVCNACQLAKSKRKSYPSMNLKCQKTFQIIH